MAVAAETGTEAFHMALEMGMGTGMATEVDWPAQAHQRSVDLATDSLSSTHERSRVLWWLIRPPSISRVVAEKGSTR